MITDDDRVKILDFGVAKLFEPVSTSDAEAVTRAGRRGQHGNGRWNGRLHVSRTSARAGPSTRGRTCSRSGVMLFEMATGRAPFQGDTPAAVFDHLLNGRPLAADSLNPRLPRSLAAVIDNALEKDPERRYRSAAELSAMICRRIEARCRSRSRVGDQSRPTTEPSSSLVVLPFVDMSPEKDQEVLLQRDHRGNHQHVDASARIAGDFAHVGFRVPGEGPGRHRDRPAVASWNGARGQRSQGREPRARDGAARQRRWRLPALVEALRSRAVGHLCDSGRDCRDHRRRAPSRARRRTAGGKRASLDVVAHEAYLRGMYALNKWSEDSMRRAIADFREAIAQDSGFAPAYAALAEGYIWLYSGLGILPASETVPQARSAVERALALDPTLADAHKVGALIAMNHDWDRRGSEESLTRALQLGPGSAAAHLWNAWRLALLERRHDQALIELEEAERLDPLDLQLKTQIGYVHYFHHDLDRAIEQFERVAGVGAVVRLCALRVG